MLLRDSQQELDDDDDSKIPQEQLNPVVFNVFKNLDGLDVVSALDSDSAHQFHLRFCIGQEDLKA